MGKAFNSIKTNVHLRELVFDSRESLINFCESLIDLCPELALFGTQRLYLPSDGLKGRFCWGFITHL